MTLIGSTPATLISEFIFSKFVFDDFGATKLGPLGPPGLVFGILGAIETPFGGGALRFWPERRDWSLFTSSSADSPLLKSLKYIII